jgi:hypothetical protein
LPSPRPARSPSHRMDSLERIEVDASTSTYWDLLRLKHPELRRWEQDWRKRSIENAKKPHKLPPGIYAANRMWCALNALHGVFCWESVAGSLYNFVRLPQFRQQAHSAWRAYAESQRDDDSIQEVIRGEPWLHLPKLIAMQMRGVVESANAWIDRADWAAKRSGFREVSIALGNRELELQAIPRLHEARHLIWTASQMIDSHLGFSEYQLSQWQAFEHWRRAAIDALYAILQLHPKQAFVAVREWAGDVVPVMPPSAFFPRGVPIEALPPGGVKWIRNPQDRPDSEIAKAEGERVDGHTEVLDEAQTLGLTDVHVIILKRLKERQPRCLTRVSIADMDSHGVLRNRETVNEAVAYLLEHQLVDEPHGPRKGVCINQSGLSALDKSSQS